MKVAVTGAGGLVGSRLCAYLRESGHEPIAVKRVQGKFDLGAFAGGVDGVVHLAGESIAAKRWSAQQKAKLRQSRIELTRWLCDELVARGAAPKVFVCASAIGYYGSRGDEVLTEESSKGTGFLADLCADWERSCETLAAAGTRVVQARISMVLSKNGGALGKLLPIFQLGGGGPIGNGKQWMSWIDELDLARALLHALETDVCGPVNMCAPNAVTNAEFTRVLAEVLSRPAFLPVPEIALRTMMGELADELLLSSQRCEPRMLQKSGFSFSYPDLRASLMHVLRADQGVRPYGIR